jgi:hypothetical protein
LVETPKTVATGWLDPKQEKEKKKNDCQRSRTPNDSLLQKKENPARRK